MDSKQKQVEIAEELQLLWLERMKSLFDSGAITSTDMATLQRFLSANGWTLDPTRLTKSLRDKLTSNVDPMDFENDGDVIPIRKQG